MQGYDIKAVLLLPERLRKLHIDKLLHMLKPEILGKSSILPFLVAYFLMKNQALMHMLRLFQQKYLTMFDNLVSTNQFMVCNVKKCFIHYT